jgi:DNA-binding transcriptional LysR family regulator
MSSAPYNDEKLSVSFLNKQIDLQLPQLDVESVILFYLVAREGNFTRASEKLHLGEPALSRRVKSLEKQIGLKLFLIKNRVINLTHAGDILFRHGEQIHRLAMDSEKQLIKMKGSELKIGVASSLVPFVASAISGFLRKHRDVNVTFASGSSFEIAQQTADLKHDISFVYSVASNLPRLRENKLSDSQSIVFVASPDLNDFKENMDIIDLYNNCTFIVGPEKSGARFILLKIFEGLGLHFPPFLVSMDSLESAIALAVNGAGILATHTCGVQELLRQRRLKVITAIDNIGISAVSPQNAQLNDIGNTLISLARDHLKRGESNP